MKKAINILLIIILAAVSTSLLFACTGNIDKYTLSYIAGDGGSISGKSIQTVKSGKNASTVTAVPNEGYEFVSWSDGVETAERTDKNVSADLTVTAEFKQRETVQTYTITYSAGEHGRIEGPLTQTVEEGKIIQDVEAVPDEWYEFDSWSDGYSTPNRWDGRAQKDINATVLFKRKEATLKLNYQSGVTDNKIEEVTFHIDNYADAVFPVPTKERFEFQGWFLRYKPLHNDYFPNWFAGEEQRVTDENGKLLPDKELINADPAVQEIYAKWQATETQTFKILLVYVTRVEARLPNIFRTKYIDVDYTMSTEEREFCEVMTKQLKRAMDVMMDGLVEFEIDEYYTTQTVVTENFRQGSRGEGRITNSLFPQQIPEMTNMLKDYGSVLTISNLNCFSLDANDYLHHESGAAGPSYGEVYLDNILRAFYLNDLSIQDLLSDLNNSYWSGGLEVAIHELSHTIEMRINTYDYHESCVNIETDDGELFNSIYANRLYYLQEIDIDGERVGIPYGFWKDDIVIVKYEPSDNSGYVWGNGYNYLTRFDGYAVGIYYEVLKGYDTPTVTAKPFPGYRFVGWSDGVATATRTDANVTENCEFTAYFEPIDYTLIFTAQEGGKVEGTTQSVLQRNNSVYVQAVADEGYEFVGWSDGYTKAARIFIIDALTIELFDENNSLTITALFRKKG